MRTSLILKLPTTLKELEDIAVGFTNELIDAEGFLYGLVSALDGGLCTHKSPSFEGNPADYVLDAIKGLGQTRRRFFATTSYDFSTFVLKDRQCIG